jgi:hypothetical protein
MSAVAGPLAAFSGLLALGGALKLRQPSNTVNALQAAGIPATATAVRALAAAELVIGVGALVTDGPAFAVLVAASYAAFTAFVALALSRHTPLDTCGCFGEPDTPPTVLHVVVTAGATVTAIAAATTGTSVPEVVADQPWGGVPFVAVALLIAYLCYLVMAVLPRSGVVH